MYAQDSNPGQGRSNGFHRCDILFTAIINNRLKLFTEKHDLIGWAQSGFRKGYATTERKCIYTKMSNGYDAS